MQTARMVFMLTAQWNSAAMRFSWCHCQLTPLVPTHPTENETRALVQAADRSSCIHTLQQTRHNAGMKNTVCSIALHWRPLTHFMPFHDIGFTAMELTPAPSPRFVRGDLQLMSLSNGAQPMKMQTCSRTGGLPRAWCGDAIVHRRRKDTGASPL